MSANHIVLSVLFFREAHDATTWIAQALEHDIAAHGVDIEDAKIAFERTVFGYVQMATKYGQSPLATLKPAPPVFWQVWRHLAEPKLEAQRMPTTDAYMLPVVTNDPLPTLQ